MTSEIYGRVETDVSGRIRNGLNLPKRRLQTFPREANISTNSTRYSTIFPRDNGSNINGAY